MQHTSLVLIELGGLFFLLGLLGRMAHRLRISPIPLYLLGGLALGQGGLLPLSSIGEFSEIASQIGVVLLLLLLGLEYSAQELVSGIRRSWSAGLVDLLLNALPGVAVALLLGWGWIGALVMAGVTFISSSGIVAKVLGDLGRLGNRETPVILSLLVMEDLVMAFYLPVLTATLAGLTLLDGLSTVAIAVAAVVVVLVIAIRFGHLVAALLVSPMAEIFLLSVLGAALLVAGVASALQVSAAVGAFLLGIAISGPTASNASKLLEPLRDLFAAMFFVVFGLNTDPQRIPPVLAIAALLAVATVLTKLVTGWFAARRQGVAVAGQVRAGAALVARGEFSIVIAGLAVASGQAPPKLAALATAYVLLMAVIGPLLARFAEPIGRRVARRLPAQWQPISAQQTGH